jgi:CDP-diacylglycerol--glycerol-3-phosphate 3-phosphatidyltransferase
MSRSDTAALWLVGAVLLSMPTFAVVARGRPRDADVARRPTTALLGYWIRDWAMWILGPIDRALVGAHVSPTVLNFVGALLGLAAGVVYARGAFATAGWLVLLGGAADILDGRVARALGVASPFGEFLDSTLDRFAETFAFVGLAMAMTGTAWAELAVALALGGSLLVSYARAKGELVGVDTAGGLMQRAERLVRLAAASLADAPVVAWTGWRPGTLLAGTVAVIGVLSMATAAYRTALVARTLRRGDGEEAP